MKEKCLPMNTEQDEKLLQSIPMIVIDNDVLPEVSNCEFESSMVNKKFDPNLISLQGYFIS